MAYTVNCMASQSLGFKSAGVHRLDLGLEIIQPLSESKKSLSPCLPSSTGQASSVHDEELPPKRVLTWIERHQREQQELKEQRGTIGFLWTAQSHISADNIGYGLLRKAGWSEGSGLGAKEQVCARVIKSMSSLFLTQSNNELCSR